MSEMNCEHFDECKAIANWNTKLQEQVAALKDFAIWMTGCGYDFCQHDYFIQQRDKLLKDYQIGPFDNLNPWRRYQSTHRTSVSSTKAGGRDTSELVERLSFAIKANNEAIQEAGNSDSDKNAAAFLDSLFHDAADHIEQLQAQVAEYRDDNCSMEDENEKLQKRVAALEELNKHALENRDMLLKKVAALESANRNRKEVNAQMLMNAAESGNRNYLAEIDDLQAKVAAMKWLLGPGVIMENLALREQAAALEKNCAFFRCCALSGEQPKEGAEPHPPKVET